MALLNQENVHRAALSQAQRKVRALYSPLIETLSSVLARGVAAGVFRSVWIRASCTSPSSRSGHFWCANLHTLSAIFGEDLATEQALAEREAHAVEVVLGYLRP